MVDAHRRINFIENRGADNRAVDMAASSEHGAFFYGIIDKFRTRSAALRSTSEPSTTLFSLRGLPARNVSALAASLATN